MRVWMTGGTGFVGSNIAYAALDRGASVLSTVHSHPGDVGFETQPIDMTSRDQVAGSISDYQPDIVIHCAILNDWDRMYADRQYAWDAYVTATENTIDAANDVGAPYVVVSTDWVFDGTQAGAGEDTPPNPVNLYGMLKFASERTALERGGAVARVSGVNGLHRTRPESPRQQDPGFGYFVASIVDALGRGDTFTVWEDDTINMVATPSLASECGEIMLDVGTKQLGGIFHCCGTEPVTRRQLAELTCDVFDLDPQLLRYGPAPATAMPKGGRVPYDTSLSRNRTADLLGRPGLTARGLLETFRDQLQQV